MARYIWLNGEKIPVTQEIYEAYYRPEWRERKQKTAHISNLSFEAMMENGTSDQVPFATKSAEETALDKIQTEYLRNLLGTLTDEERALIAAVFIDGKTEREIATIFGISQKAVNKRKHRILEKLKKMIKL